VQLTPKGKADLLEAIDDAFDLGGLDKLVALSFHGKTREDVTNAPTKDERVLAIVEEAARTDLLLDLLRRARQLNATNQKLEKVTVHFLGSETHRVIPASTLGEVVAAVRAANPPYSDSEIRNAWCLSVPAVWAHDYDEEKGESLLNILISRLADLPGAAGRSPMLEFLIHMREARVADIPLDDRFNVWRDAIRRHLDIDDSDYLAIDRAAHETRQRASEMHLHVSIVVAPGPDDRFDVVCHQLRASSISDRWNDGVFDSRGVAKDCNAADIEGVVSQHIRTILDATEIPTERLMVHLFLPLTLWSAEADQWPLPSRRNPQPLGAELDVVVRSWERPWDSTFRDAKKAWKRLWSQHVQRPEAKLLDRDLFKNLRMQMYKDHYSCAALSFVPNPTDFEEVVDSGMPIAVWIRSSVIPEDELRAIASDLSACPADWIDRVRQYRVEAAANETGVGQHFFLMWDDPQKLPPSAPGEVPLEDPNQG
jgi:hypothetical protein